MNDTMTINYVSNGDPERIPRVGEQIPVQDHLFFVVDGYGESKEVSGAKYDLSNEKVYEIELKGHLLIPKGSPIEVLEDLLGGKIL